VGRLAEAHTSPDDEVHLSFPGQDTVQLLGSYVALTGSLLFDASGSAELERVQRTVVSEAVFVAD